MQSSDMWHIRNKLEVNKGLQIQFHFDLVIVHVWILVDCLVDTDVDATIDNLCQTVVAMTGKS